MCYILLPFRHQLNDVAWQPSKLELEAQLGASRERQAELEWRLSSMEGLLRQHAQLLGQGPGQYADAPLGSLLDAIDDGHVSPPRRQVGRLAMPVLAPGQVPVLLPGILPAACSFMGCSHTYDVPSLWQFKPDATPMLVPAAASVCACRGLARLSWRR